MRFLLLPCIYLKFFLKYFFSVIAFLSWQLSKQINSKKNLIEILNLILNELKTQHNSSITKQKCESQNGGNKKNEKHFLKNEHFLPDTNTPLLYYPRIEVFLFVFEKA